MICLDIVLYKRDVCSNVCFSASDSAFRIVPNRLQVFEYESVSFHCEGLDGSAQLRGIRNTEGFISACDGWASVLSCTIQRAYRADGGEYWCVTEGGQRSYGVNISVTGTLKFPDSHEINEMMF